MRLKPFAVLLPLNTALQPLQARIKEKLLAGRFIAFQNSYESTHPLDPSGASLPDEDLLNFTSHVPLDMPLDMADPD